MRMSKLPTKLIMAVVAAGIIIAATMTTLEATRFFNAATAQVRDPPFGPNCNGCITTRNLANGAVTNPKLAVASVSLGNIGAGQVKTGNIADQAVRAAKLAPGAVSLSITAVSASTILRPGTIGGQFVLCPPGYLVTGGGYDVSPNGKVFVNFQGVTGPTGWVVQALNTDSIDESIAVEAICAAIHQ